MRSMQPTLTTGSKDYFLFIAEICLLRDRGSVQCRVPEGD